jgi:serine/threonine protein kinase
MRTTNLKAAHPAPDELRRFLSGELTEPDCERLAGHLTDCTSCRQTLAEQSRTDEFLQELRQPLVAEPHSEEPQCAEVIARLARSVPAPTGSPTTADRDTGGRPGAAPRIDTIFGILPCDFGRYRILSRLGGGGMGAVYLAADTVLQRQVALKISHFPGDPDSEWAQRFLREARTAAGLEHEGICRVLDYGFCNGIHFFTMEYIRGQPLSALLAEGQPVEPRRAAALVRAVALALDTAHRQGVIHRDLKPGNIMLAHHDGLDRPRVVDFGLARGAEDPALTATGAVIGTLRYMSPEQVDGKEVGPASDIYSLGVVLYELLTGRLPYQGATRSEIIYAIAKQPLERPSRHRPGLDPVLDALCLKALAKAPAERFATMADFAAALQEYLDRKTPLPSKRRRLLPWGVGVGALLLVLAGLGVAAWSLTHDWHANVAPPTQPDEGRLEPVRGWVDVRIWRPELGLSRDLGLHDNDALPLTADSEVSVAAELNRPAYLYVIWIDGKGEAAPVYPWKPGHWEQRLAEEQPISRLRRPADEHAFWSLKKQQPGMETLLLLVRETPWPAEVDLEKVLAGLPEQKMQNAAAAVWFENWQVVKDEEKRGPQFFDERRREDPVLETQRLLQERLGQYCTYSRAVSFANRGK